MFVFICLCNINSNILNTKVIRKFLGCNHEKAKTGLSLGEKAGVFSRVSIYYFKNFLVIVAV